jgi:hypothetical protein
MNVHDDIGNLIRTASRRKESSPRDVGRNLSHRSRDPGNAKVQPHEIVFDEGKGLSTEKQQYDPTSMINELRHHVDQWRNLPNPNSWQVTPETARLLQHWRHHSFGDVRPFFCQLEAVETTIWLTEVAPQTGKTGKRFLEHLASANKDAHPELIRLALKLATGAGKTTVMAMLIAWQTINAVRRPQSNKFSRGFLIVAPGLTIRDRLRVLLPNDPDSYYARRDLVPLDMLDDIGRAKIVVTNYHAFKLILMQCGEIRHRVSARQQAFARPFRHLVLPRPTAFRLPLQGGRAAYSRDLQSAQLR